MLCASTRFAYAADVAAATAGFDAPEKKVILIDKANFLILLFCWNDLERTIYFVRYLGFVQMTQPCLSRIDLRKLLQLDGHHTHDNNLDDTIMCSKV